MHVVCRRILANEPILHRAACLYTSLPSTRQRPCTSPHHGSIQSRRTFLDFNMFAPRKRDVKEASMDPGIEDMMHLAKMQRMKARLPPVKHVVQALNIFFAAKRKGKSNLNDTQAKLALQCFRYCLENEEKEKALSVEQSTKAKGRGPPSAFEAAITDAIWVFNVGPDASASAHVELAEFLYGKRREKGDGGGSNTFRLLSAAYAYAMTLSFNGRALDARRLAESLEQARLCTNPQSSSVSESVEESKDDEAAAEDAIQQLGIRDPVEMERIRPRLAKIWAVVLRGFGRENNEEELLATMTSLQAQSWFTGIDGNMASAMLSFYLRTDRLDAVQNWYQRYWQTYMDAIRGEDGEEAPGAQKASWDKFVSVELKAVVQWCLAHQQLDFGHQVVRQAMINNPPKLVWDAIFVWAAGTGKGADEIGRMLDVMEKSNDDILHPDEWRTPDITTINSLIEFATSKQDPYLAERFIALGKARQIEPDARTYQLQMQYRLEINDVDGALIAYKNLQAMDLSSNEDVPTVNNLIVALCQSKRHDFDTVMNVAMDLADRRARFKPETVTALALLHLNRDEMHDVIDLLNTHSHHYSSTDRAGILDTILTFCLNPKTPTSRSWDAYKILGTVFDEMSREQRTAVMSNFYITHKRPDMAVFIFNEMRRHSRADTIPTIDTYVSSFLGSAALRDLDSLEVIHNQLKLDYNINTTTYLINAMMIAYTACDRPRLALGFWNDIVASREGPTYNSIHIALRACEKAPLGDLRAKEIWATLRKMSVHLDQKLWASYAGALVGNGDNESAFQIIEAAEGKGECVVDVELLGSMMDGCTTEGKQREVESWARNKSEGAWEELEKCGFEVDEESGKRVPRIERSVVP